MNQKTGKTCIVTMKSVTDKHIWRRCKEVRHSTPGSQLCLTARDLRKDHTEEFNGSMELYSKFSLSATCFKLFLHELMLNRLLPPCPQERRSWLSPSVPSETTTCTWLKAPTLGLQSQALSQNTYMKRYIYMKWNCKLTPKQCRIILVTLC